MLNRDLITRDYELLNKIAKPVITDAIEHMLGCENYTTNNIDMMLALDISQSYSSSLAKQMSEVDLVTIEKDGVARRYVLNASRIPDKYLS
jgi:hypothetical protein